MSIKDIIAESTSETKERTKAKRINMAFTDDNYNFIRLASRGSGKTMTEIVNIAVDYYRQDHQELDSKLKEVIELL